MLNQLVKGRFDGSAAKPQWTVANDDGFGGTVTIEPDDSGVPSDRSIEIDYTRENVWIRSVFWDGMDKDDFDGKKLWDGMEDATIFRIDCAKIPEFWLEVDVSKLPIEEDKEEKDKGESKKNGKKKQGDCAYADPFEDLEEDQLDDCITELFECDDLNGELEQGYDCTYEQALYWLKNKYIEETSYGEDLYNRIKKEIIKKKIKKARKN